MNNDYKKTAIINEFTIGVRPDNSIEVLIDGKPFHGNVARLLRDEIAPLVSFDVDSKWNTQQLGRKLVDAVNSTGNTPQQGCGDRPTNDDYDFCSQLNIELCSLMKSLRNFSFMYKDDVTEEDMEDLLCDGITVMAGDGEFFTKYEDFSDLINGWSVSLWNKEGYPEEFSFIRYIAEIQYDTYKSMELVRITRYFDDDGTEHVEGEEYDYNGGFLMARPEKPDTIQYVKAAIDFIKNDNKKGKPWPKPKKR